MAHRTFPRARPRLTYANVMSTIAMFLALGGGAVMAKQTLLNGKRIKPGTIPANRIKKHSLTSTQIKLSKLGTVQSATHALSADNATHASSADAVGGLGPSAFLGSSHLLKGALPATGGPLFSDSDTGADVSVDSGSFIRITNTNPADNLTIRGVSSLNGELIWQAADLAPGGTKRFVENTVPTQYLDLIVLRVHDATDDSAELHLTCGVETNGEDLVSCIGVR
jgi:hypothetical protein